MGTLSAGMSIRDAKQRCPAAVVLEGDRRSYQAFAERVFDICRDFSPAVETYLDEAYCDLGGTARLHGTIEDAARNLKARVKADAGLSVSVGVAAFTDQTNYTELFKMADKRLYEAKTEGRDRVKVARVPTASLDFAMAG